MERRELFSRAFFFMVSYVLHPLEGIVTVVA